jgi:hypothetical protein
MGERSGLPERSSRLHFGPEVQWQQHSDGRIQEMMKSKVFMASAALAGLLAGSSASLQASNLAAGLAGSHAQDATDKKVKEKHSCKGQNSCKGKGGCKSSDNGCKGQNSCKGKGGCATDGSKMPE